MSRPAHGTDAGYYRHYRAREDACLPCRAAHASTSRERRQRNGYPAHRSIPCVECGTDTVAGRCQSCASLTSWRKRHARAAAEIAYTGAWVAVGGILRPVRRAA